MTSPDKLTRKHTMTGLSPLTDAAGVIDTTALRNTFGRFPSGVTALCALDTEGRPIGMAVSAFVGVSLDPPLVGIYLQRTSTTWPQLRDRPRIGLSVMGAGQADVCRQLAARTGDRFAGLNWHATADGAVLLHGATAWFETDIAAESAAGDHELALLRIHGQALHQDNAPLVFYASAFHGLGTLDQSE
jgi:flavin reductase (DIM6/NTAB) family NADH-FMN oxidoreductase RutF